MILVQGRSWVWLVGTHACLYCGNTVCVSRGREVGADMVPTNVEPKPIPLNLSINITNWPELLCAIGQVNLDCIICLNALSASPVSLLWTSVCKINQCKCKYGTYDKLSSHKETPQATSWNTENKCKVLVKCYTVSFNRFCVLHQHWTTPFTSRRSENCLLFTVKESLHLHN